MVEDFDEKGAFTCEAKAAALPAVLFTASEAKFFIESPSLTKALLDEENEASFDPNEGLGTSIESKHNPYTLDKIFINQNQNCL